MEMIEAKQIVDLIKNIDNNYFSDFTIKEKIVDIEYLNNFHDWVTGRPFEGGFCIEDKNNNTYWLLFLEWNKNLGYHLVIFPENKSGPIAEIHKVIKNNQWKELVWNYSPRKRDKNNQERKDYFRKYFGDTEVIISIPQKIEEVSDFFQEIFILSENRIKADNLEEIVPLRRDSFPEGKKIQKLHYNRERNSTVVKLAKEEFRKINKRLFCQICGFDFKEKYGELGDDYIEAHHIKPLSELTEEETTTSIEEIALVCSNCHRMLHRKRPWLSIENLNNLINDK